MIYCLSCKKKTPDNNLTAKITKNKKPYVQSNLFCLPKIKITICFYIKNKR